MLCDAAIDEPGTGHQPGEKQRGDKIAEDDDDPVLGQLEPRDFTVQGGFGEQGVAGEQLGAADNDQHQADREDTAAEEAGDATAQVGGRVVGHDRCQLGPEGDVEAGQQAEDDGVGNRLC